MGKWSVLKDKLPKLPVEVKFDDGAKYQEKVDAVKQQMQARGLTELGEAISQLREEKDQIAEVLSDVEVQLEAASQLLAERMEDQGLTSIKLDSGESFLLKDEPYTSVTDKAANREWFEQNGLRELLSVNWQTLNSLVKGILEDPIDHHTGQPKELPAGIEVYMKTSITRRKGAR